MTITVNGTVKTAQDDPVAYALVKFKPLSTPQAISGGDVIIGTVQQVRASAVGAFTIDLWPGDYEVWVNNVKLFTIAVPDNGGPYDITDLVTGDLTYVFSGGQSGLFVCPDDGRIIKLVVRKIEDGAYAVELQPQG